MKYSVVGPRGAAVAAPPTAIAKCWILNLPHGCIYLFTKWEISKEVCRRRIRPGTKGVFALLSGPLINLCLRIWVWFEMEWWRAEKPFLRWWNDIPWISLVEDACWRKLCWRAAVRLFRFQLSTASSKNCGEELQYDYSDSSSLQPIAKTASNRFSRTILIPALLQVSILSDPRVFRVKLSLLALRTPKAVQCPVRQKRVIPSRT